MKQAKPDMKILNSFARFLTESEHTPATREKYLRDCRRFIVFCAGRPLEKQLLLDWREQLLASHYTVGTVNGMLASVHSLLSFLEREDCRLRPLREQRRIFRDSRRELDREEYLRLLSTARQSGKERLLLVMQTICSTGIRVSELQFVTRESLDRRYAQIRCKGKTRLIMLPEALCRKLRQYAYRHQVRSGSIFVTRNGRPLDRSNIWREMKQLCLAAGVLPSKVFPRNLRHLFARSFYQLDRDLSKLADVLGYSSLETTRIYIMESSQNHERLLGRLNLLL